MRIFIFFSIALALTACSKQANFTVSGTVKGLKKGTIYLQKIEDTALISLDSLVVDGDPDFNFNLEIKEPEVLYLHLDKSDGSGYDDRILFFAEAGNMNITTSLKNFEGFAAIIGSENQIKLTQFQNINKQFNDQNLNLIKGSFDAQKSGDQEAIIKYDDSLNNLLKKRYLYTGNFAVTNKELAVAPYLVLTQIPDASLTYLDTLYNKFPLHTRKSLYGRQLKKLIDSRAIN